MPAPFEDYQRTSEIASKVGGPKNLGMLILSAGAILGAVAIETTRPLWKPLLDNVREKLRSEPIKVIDADGTVQEMTSSELVSKALPELAKDRPGSSDSDDVD